MTCSPVQDIKKNSHSICLIMLLSSVVAAGEGLVSQICENNQILVFTNNTGTFFPRRFNTAWTIIST